MTKIPLKMWCVLIICILFVGCKPLNKLLKKKKTKTVEVVICSGGMPDWSCNDKTRIVSRTFQNPTTIFEKSKR